MMPLRCNVVCDNFNPLEQFVFSLIGVWSYQLSNTGMTDLDYANNEWVG